jgi:hypothetical protein
MTYSVQDGTMVSCSLNGAAFSLATCGTADYITGGVSTTISTDPGTATLAIKTLNKDWTWFQKQSISLTRTRQTNQTGFATTETANSLGRPNFTTGPEDSAVSTNGSGTGWNQVTASCYSTADATTGGGTPGTLALTVANAGPAGTGDTAMQAIKGNCASAFGSKVYSNKFYNWGDNIFFQAKTVGTGTPFGTVRFRNYALTTMSSISSGTITSTYKSCSLDQPLSSDTSVGDVARMDFVGGAASGTTGGIYFDQFTSNGSNTTVSATCASSTAP